MKARECPWRRESAAERSAGPRGGTLWARDARPEAAEQSTSGALPPRRPMAASVVSPGRAGNCREPGPGSAGCPPRESAAGDRAAVGARGGRRERPGSVRHGTGRAGRQRLSTGCGQAPLRPSEGPGQRGARAERPQRVPTGALGQRGAR